MEIFHGAAHEGSPHIEVDRIAGLPQPHRFRLLLSVVFGSIVLVGTIVFQGLLLYRFEGVVLHVAEIWVHELFNLLELFEAVCHALGRVQVI